MRTFEGTISCGLIIKSDFEFEVEDNATDEEIKQEAWQAVCEKIDFSYKEVEHIK